MARFSLDYTDQADRPVQRFDGRNELAEAYREARRTPKEHEAFLEVACHGMLITIFDGSPTSPVQAMTEDREPPYLLALSPVPAPGTTDFFPDGHHTEIANRNTLLAADVDRIVLDFIETGELTKKFAWEHV
ncbi:MAG: hypothetical protein AAF270_15605 [Pseudomonadota bacterium]